MDEYRVESRMEIFFFQAEDGIRDIGVTGVQTCALPIYAFLDRAPLVALTGQGDLERMHKESHQYLDLVSIMKPVTKWNARVTNPRIVPEVVRKAFKVAQAQKPGPTHLELPEDVMAEELDASPLPVPGWVRRPKPSREELRRAASVIDSAERPVVLVGNGVTRVGAAEALRDFSH